MQTNVSLSSASGLEGAAAASRSTLMALVILGARALEITSISFRRRSRKSLSNISVRLVVFAEVLYGLKRWFITAPEYKPQFHPNETSYVWLHKHYQPLLVSHPEQLYECVLRPGEVLFIGHSWWHATLNIGDTVFISTFL